MSLLELELDDWLDPSLPRMYRDEELRSYGPILSNEFTADNEDFEATFVLPPYLPVKLLNDAFYFTRRE
jgi:hypothetical protein